MQDAAKRHSLGSNLRAERARHRGLTQSELALRVGVSRRTITNWEADISCPRVDQLQLIAEALDVPMSSLLPAKAGGPDWAAQAA